METAHKTRSKVGEVMSRAAMPLAKLLVGAALVSGLMMPGKAHADSIELMAGHKSTTIDLKVSAPLADKVGIFLRVRPAVDYSGKIDAFGVADVSVKLIDGLDAVGEIQLIGGKVVPRAGIQYFVSSRDANLYTLATVGLDSTPYLESLTSLNFSPSLADGIRLIIQVEDVTDFNGTGHLWSTQRIRFGVGFFGWGIGAAVDLTETGNHPKTADGTFGCNIGGFVSRAF